jgi:hypothetical protein
MKSMKLRALLKRESFNQGKRFQAGGPGRFWCETLFVMEKGRNNVLTKI